MSRKLSYQKTQKIINAIKSNDLDTIKGLNLRSLNFFVDNFDGNIYHTCIRYGKVEIFKFLLTTDVSLDFKNREERTPLIYASFALSYIECTGTNINCAKGMLMDLINLIGKDCYNNSPHLLIDLAVANETDLIIKLYEGDYGFKGHLDESCPSWNILTTAARKCNTRLIEYVIEKCPNTLSFIDNNQMNALNYSIKNKDVKSAEVLLKADSDISIGQNGYKVIHYAVLSGSLEILKLIIRYGGDIEAVSEGSNVYYRDGRSTKLTPLQIACRRGHHEIVEWLLSPEVGLDPLLQDEYGKDCKWHLENTDREEKKSDLEADRLSRERINRCISKYISSY